MALTTLLNMIFPILLITALLYHPTSASTLADWLYNPPSEQGALIQEIQCYALPYGAIGFISHILTYYTIVMLVKQRCPYAPWRRNTHSTLGFIIAATSLILTTTVSILTILRCRHRWQFITIAAWKLDLSLTFGMLTLHAAHILRRSQQHRERQPLRTFPPTLCIKPASILFWLLLYLPGLAAGMVGLLSLVSQTIATNQNVRIATAVFGGLALVFLVFLVLLVVASRLFDLFDARLDRAREAGFLAFLAAAAAVVGVLAAFYSDWVLAAVAENMTGVPRGANEALYWVYFVAKRLPLLFS